MKTTIILGSETVPMEVDSVEVAVQVGPITIEIGETGVTIANYKEMKDFFFLYEDLNKED